MGKYVEYIGQKRPVWKPNKEDLLLTRKCAERGLLPVTIVAKLREAADDREEKPLTIVEFERSVKCFPALLEAFESGKANGEIVLTEKLWAKALQDSSKDQLQAIKFLLEKRFGWSAQGAGQQGSSDSQEPGQSKPTGLSTQLVDSK